MSFFPKMREYLKLLRLQSSAITGIMPVLGALSAGITENLFVLFLIAFLVHIYVFTLNEYKDIGIDKLSIYLKEKPLVKGSIPAEHALYICTGSLLLSIIITALHFKNLYALILLMLAVFLGSMYDFYSKKFYGMDFVLAGCAFFLVLLGAFPDQNFITYTVAGVIFIRTVIQNGIIGALKDVDHDALGGARTIPLVLSVRVEGNRFHVPLKFKLSALFFELIFIYLLILLLKEYTLKTPHILILLLIILGLFITLNFLFMTAFEREILKKKMGYHEFFGLSLMALVFGIALGNLAFLLVLFSIAWFACFTLIAYGTKLAV